MSAPDGLARDRSRLGGIAVHVPLDEVDRISGQKPLQRRVDVLYHLAAPEIQNQLVAPLGARPAGEVQHPVRDGCGTGPSRG